MKRVWVSRRNDRLHDGRTQADAGGKFSAASPTHRPQATVCTENRPRPHATPFRVPRPAAPSSWTQRLRRPNRPFSSYPPPRAAWRQTHTCPMGQPRTARQPRRQRRVARPSGTATVCTENRENPRATPFRVPLPWPPRGGLGAGGQGVFAASRVWHEKTFRNPATAPQCRKAIRPPARRAVLLDPTLTPPQSAIFFVSPAKGSVETNPHLPCGAAAHSPPTTSSAPRRPPIGHRDRVYGKPRKAARRAIPRPTPLAPWRGPRGWGLGGDGCKPGMARKDI